MGLKQNPFNELYVSETVKPEQFVHLFSPVLVKHVEEIFLPGNVVLQGVQGSGKTMLLNLLKPEVRIAYLKNRLDFPVAEHGKRFVGAGINLNTSRATDFGQRVMSSKGMQEIDLLPLYFGDFLNFWIVYDLLKSIQTLCQYPFLAEEIGLSYNSEIMNEFAKKIARDDCWFGSMKGVETHREFEARLVKRISEYRAFLNFNLVELSPEVGNTKTQVGIPISKTVEALRKNEVLGRDVNVFVRIDQYEELFHLEGLRNEFGREYRAIVNKALGTRDASASYRIGTRRYAWKEQFDMFATTARLERDRNYKLVDLDTMLRRAENRRTWVFPDFAQDVFVRRLEMAGYQVSDRSTALMKVFGRGLSPKDKAVIYCKRSPLRAVRIELDWPTEWREFLQELAMQDPLQARLAEAWCRQKRSQGVMQRPPRQPFPWLKKYWVKERLEAALMQIAGRSAQRMLWEGKDDVLHLSGGNILVFVSICQHIWDAWLRTTRDLQDSDSLPRIDTNEQAVGIYEASRHWFNKVAENSDGMASKRQRFIALVGGILERRLYNDLSLSYPGENGFSVALEELRADKDTAQFLNEAVYFGDLFSAPHTTKLKDRKPRRKWYLNTILSPHFRLPHTHTKEPWYVPISTVKTWMTESERTDTPIPTSTTTSKSVIQDQRQMRLFHRASSLSNGKR